MKKGCLKGRDRGNLDVCKDGRKATGKEGSLRGRKVV